MNRQPEYQEVYPIPAPVIPMLPSESIFYDEIYLLGTPTEFGRHIYAAYSKLRVASDVPKAPHGYGECFIDHAVNTHTAKRIGDEWLRDNLDTMRQVNDIEPIVTMRPQEYATRSLWSTLRKPTQLWKPGPFCIKYTVQFTTPPNDFRF